MKKIYTLSLTALFAGCSIAPINPGAETVRLTNVEPGKECKFLGDVVGNEGDFLRGALISNANLEIGAKNDLKNKAAAMGGNVVNIITQRAGQSGGGTDFGSRQTNVTLSGNVYKCPD